MVRDEQLSFFYESFITYEPDRIRTPHTVLYDQFVYDKDGRLTSYYNHNRRKLMNFYLDEW